jgi:DNA-binding NtrC family response regulator
MDGNLSRSAGPISFPRILIAESNLATVESLVHTIDDSRVDLNYDVCTSRQSAVIKLFRSPAPYNVIISSVHLAEMDDFLLLKHNRALQPFVPFVVTNRVSEAESSRRALEEGAFDVISLPPKYEQVVSTIRLALWQSKLMTLITCKERALEKYRDHIAAYPSGNQMDEAFKRTLSSIQQSIFSYQQSILRVDGFADLATKVENQTRKRALDRLDVLQPMDFGEVREGP